MYQSMIDRYDSRQRERQSALRTKHHLMNRTEWIGLEYIDLLKINFKLNGDFMNILVGTGSLCPHVLEIRGSDENQVVVT